MHLTRPHQEAKQCSLQVAPLLSCLWCLSPGPPESSLKSYCSFSVEGDRNWHLFLAYFISHCFIVPYKWLITDFPDYWLRTAFMIRYRTGSKLRRSWFKARCYRKFFNLRTLFLMLNLEHYSSFVYHHFPWLQTCDNLNVPLHASAQRSDLRKHLLYLQKKKSILIETNKTKPKTNTTIIVFKGRIFPIKHELASLFYVWPFSLAQWTSPYQCSSDVG